MTKSEATTILSQVGKDLSISKVEEALKLTMGLDSMLSSRSDVRYTEEYYDEELYYGEEYYEPPANEWYDDDDDGQ